MKVKTHPPIPIYIPNLKFVTLETVLVYASIKTLCTWIHPYIPIGKYALEIDHERKDAITLQKPDFLNLLHPGELFLAMNIALLQSFQSMCTNVWLDRNLLNYSLINEYLDFFSFARANNAVWYSSIRFSVNTTQN